MTLPCRPPLLAVAAALLSAVDGVSLRAVPRDQSWQGAPPVRLDQRLRGGHGSNGSAARGMSVLGHTVSEVSERWGSNVVYAIFTSAIPKYREKLETQLETWAARPAAEGRYVAVGGKNYPDAWRSGSILRSDCGDDMSSISCKEATLLAEGAARGADWLYVIGEDNYVHTGRVEEFLSDKDPSANVAYGVVGCGKGSFCVDNEAYNSHGGICGGSGYIISRTALQRLLAGGAPALHAVYDKTPWPNDMTTSCQLRKHGADLLLAENMYGFPIADLDEFEGFARQGSFLTVHYVHPDTMRWFHALNEGSRAAVLQPLQKKAFDRGCSRAMKERMPKAWVECMQRKGFTARDIDAELAAPS